MIQAILYTSNTGTTEKYAQLLGEATGLPVYPLKKAEGKVPDGAEILYLGWIFANGVKGYKAAAKRYTVRAVCAVGMGETGTQTAEVRKQTAVPDVVPLFTLQGGLNMKKLHGFYRVIMNGVITSAGKSLAAKPDRTPEENALLEMMRHGGDRVSRENLAAVLAWYDTAKTNG